MKYGYKWQQARAVYLRENPLCVNCGPFTPATVVDHIVPHKGSHELFWDVMNWQPLCKACHDRKTATEDGGFGRAIGKGKIRASCGIDGLPDDERHHWNK